MAFCILFNSVMSTVMPRVPNMVTFLFFSLFYLLITSVLFF